MFSISNNSIFISSLIKSLWFLIVGYAFCSPVTADEAPVKYSMMPAVDCVINPYRVADIASPVAGVIDKLHVERSQQVKAGQVVAKLEAGVEQANVELARYRAAIQSEIKLGQVSLDFDTRRKQRIDSLHEKQVISIENIDEAQREEGLSKWKLEQAKELSTIRKLELQRAEQQLRQKSIRAPFDGFVLDTFKYRGEYVEEQAILRVAQLDPLVVEAIVPMENFGMIKPGMKAEILPEIMSEEKVTAKVTIVDRIGDTASNTFGVKLVVPNPDNRIPAGLKCVVKFLEPTEDEPAVAINEEQVDSIKPQVVSNEAHDKRATANLDSDPEPRVKHSDTRESDSREGDSREGDSREGDTSAELVVPNVQMEATPSSYLVVVEQGGTDEETRDFINQLREAGINDLQEMDHGPFKGHISLGLYSALDDAKKRLQQLEQLGFSLFIRERY